jgi:hypothetical protein
MITTLTLIPFSLNIYYVVMLLARIPVASKREGGMSRLTVAQLGRSWHCLLLVVVTERWREGRILTGMQEIPVLFLLMSPPPSAIVVPVCTTFRCVVAPVAVEMAPIAVVARAHVILVVEIEVAPAVVVVLAVVAVPAVVAAPAVVLVVVPVVGVAPVDVVVRLFPVLVDL